MAAVHDRGAQRGLDRLRRRAERQGDAAGGVHQLPERPRVLRQGAGLHGQHLRPPMADTLTRAARPSPAARGRLGAASWIQRRDRRGVWFVVPFLLGFLLFMLVPLGYAVYTSLYTSRVIGGTTFTGASHYTQTLQSGQFWAGVIRVVIFGAIQIPVMLAIAFFFACVFDLGVAKYGTFFRRVFFIPFAVPAVVGAVMWSFLLEPQFGPFSRLAGALGFAN